MQKRSGGEWRGARQHAGPAALVRTFRRLRFWRRCKCHRSRTTMNRKGRSASRQCRPPSSSGRPRRRKKPATLRTGPQEDQSMPPCMWPPLWQASLKASLLLVNRARSGPPSGLSCRILASPSLLITTVEIERHFQPNESGATTGRRRGDIRVTTGSERIYYKYLTAVQTS